MSALEAAWEALARLRPSGQGWLTHRLEPASPRAVFAGIDGELGQPAVLLDVATASLPASPDLPVARGFTVQIMAQTPGPGGRAWLVLGLVETAQRSLFGVMAEDVATATLAAASDRLAVQNFLSRLRDWQSFMERQQEGGLTHEAQIGLFAELLFLEEIALEHFAPLDALAAWQGPEGGLQDWRSGDVAVEIKATTALEPSTFQVSHIGQLDERGLASLIVLHHVLEESGRGRSLPRLVEDIASGSLQEHDEARALFERRLLLAGYHAAMASRYEGRFLRLETQSCFLVQEGFPRLRGDLLPAGIVECSYSVALSACTAFEIDHPAFIRRLQGQVT